MTESTNTPNGVRNGYLDNLKTHSDVPGLYTVDVTTKNIDKIFEDYEGEGDFFSGDNNSTVAVVEGDMIREFGEADLLVGVLPANKTYAEHKAESLAKSDKAKAIHKAEIAKKAEEEKDKDIRDDN
jgi:hypothetical protein